MPCAARRLVNFLGVAAGNSLRSNIRLLSPFPAVLLSASAKGLNTGQYRHAQYNGVAGAMLE
jgi:hypothetical protein